MAEMPKRAVLTENNLLDQDWSIENINKAAIILKDEFNPISDARATADFRKTATKNLLIKFYEETKQVYATT